MTTTPKHLDETPAELSENVRNLSINVRQMAESWRDFLPVEMQIGGLFTAGMELADKQFGPGSGPAVLAQSLASLIEQKPEIVGLMAPQLSMLNKLVLAQQAKMIPPNVPQEKIPSAEAIEDLRIQLYCVKDSAVNMLDHLGDKTKTEHSIADILDDLDEAHKMLNKLEPRKPKRKAKLN